MTTTAAGPQAWQVCILKPASLSDDRTVTAPVRYNTARMWVFSIVESFFYTSNYSKHVQAVTWGFGWYCHTWVGGEMLRLKYVDIFFSKCQFSEHCHVRQTRGKVERIWLKCLTTLLSTSFYWGPLLWFTCSVSSSWGELLGLCCICLT